jgi:hypothetical protein
MEVLSHRGIGLFVWKSYLWRDRTFLFGKNERRAICSTQIDGDGEVILYTT